MSSLRPRSVIPGRERWEIGAIYRRPDLADALTEALACTPGIRRITSNPRTASVLVEFDPGTSLDVGAVLGQRMGELGDSPPARAGTARPAASGPASLSSPSSPDAPSPDKRERRPLRQLLERLGIPKKDIRRAEILSVLNAATSFLPNLAFAAVTNTARQNGSTILAGLGIAQVSGQLWFLGAAVLASHGLQLVVEYWQKRHWKNLAATIEREVKLRSFDHVQHLDMAFIDSQRSGYLLSVIVDDANSVKEFFEEGADDIIQKISTGVIINGILFVVSPGLGLVANLSLPFILMAASWFRKRAGQRYAAAARTQSEFAQVLAEDLSGIATIKSSTAEDRQIASLRALNDNAVADSFSAFRGRFMHSSTMRILFYSSWVVTVTHASYLLTTKRMARPLYSVVLFSIPQLISSMLGIDRTTNLYRKATASAERILTLLDTQSSLDSGHVRVGAGEIAGAVRFDNVCFSYREDEPVLHDIDIDLASGSVTGVVGSTGSGKSTLVKLLMRFYDPARGRITIDGRDISDLDLASLRSLIGYVGQDTFLFPGTIHDNIAFARPSASIAEVKAAAAVAEIAEFIETLPQGYDTTIGERGQTLSGGQRQRLCIARALVKDPPILVFDEATSAVDNETEAALQRSLYSLAPERTVVLIAHRLSTIRNADRIYVLHQGCIAEQGTHDELLTRNGLYSSLWRVQTGELARQAHRHGAPQQGEDT